MLKADIETIFRAVPVIHSLAPYSSTYSCATVTFPEKEPKFPLKLIEDAEFRWRRRNSGDFDFQYDIKFTGLTPLFDAEENAQVEYADDLSSRACYLNITDCGQYHCCRWSRDPCIRNL